MFVTLFLLCEIRGQSFENGEITVYVLEVNDVRTMIMGKI